MGKGDCYSGHIKKRACLGKAKSLPNDKILDHSNLTDTADGKINVTQKLNFTLGRVENIMGKCFQKAPFLTLFQTSPGFYVSTVKVF